MTDNDDYYYVCEYDKRGHPVPTFGPYPLGEACTVMEQLEQQEPDRMIPPSYTVLAIGNHRKQTHD
jgi:hypothetical protein